MKNAQAFLYIGSNATLNWGATGVPFYPGNWPKTSVYQPAALRNFDLSV